ncbi:glutamine amidotransferase [uncultured Oxalicibacterium sp.]|uniref:glutamine amidotransferase n=1 Tax=uncultured Oxalicibacterium sp. TaxID=1168540 RepID=UPI0025FB7B24|nr:glutamine amidotransferase [uncultured Oxalicibacterium sp.]
MKPLVIFKVGETFPELAQRAGDFEHWIEQGLGQTGLPVMIVDARTQTALPEWHTVAGAIVTGSHAMVTDRADWSEALAAWLREAVAQKLPLLGICYGHQLLAHALGGHVDYHPDGIEIGSVQVCIAAAAGNDPLFHDLPTSFMAHVVHRQSVRSLPSKAVVLAHNEFEAHHAFRVGETAWGVQFHPEFDHEAMRGYLQKLAPDLRKNGTDLATLESQLAYTSTAASILGKFGRFARQRSRESVA